MLTQEGFLALRAYTPASIKPGDFDFSPHLPGKKAARETKKTEKENKTEKQAEKQNEKAEEKKELPKRLLLSALSKSFNAKIAGLDKESLKYLVDEFGTSFSKSAMDKCILPCDPNMKQPYIMPDNLLPSPMWKTACAIEYWVKVNEKGDPQLLQGTNADALRDMQDVWKDGVQIEWLPVREFIQWIINQEATQKKKEKRQEVGFHKGVRASLGRHTWKFSWC